GSSHVHARSGCFGMRRTREPVRTVQVLYSARPVPAHLRCACRRQFPVTHCGTYLTCRPARIRHGLTLDWLLVWVGRGNLPRTPASARSKMNSTFRRIPRSIRLILCGLLVPYSWGCWGFHGIPGILGGS